MWARWRDQSELQQLCRTSADGRLPHPTKTAQTHRNHIGLIVSGRAVTEDEIFAQVESHNVSKAKKSVPRKNIKVSKGSNSKQKSSDPTQNSPSPRPCTSRVIPDYSPVISSLDSDSESEDEKCCVCKKSRPPAFVKLLETQPCILFWVQCDKCQHWVSALRSSAPSFELHRHTQFLCPCCHNE